jgi:hypothetical protein
VVAGFGAGVVVAGFGTGAGVGVGVATGEGVVSAPGAEGGGSVCGPQAAADSIIISMTSMTAIVFFLIIITP